MGSAIRTPLPFFKTTTRFFIGDMTSNITYEEALSRCSSALRCKLEHSVQLIRKAERLAMNYEPDDGYFLAFSGGKDSQALYHVAVVGGGKVQSAHESDKC